MDIVLKLINCSAIHSSGCLNVMTVNQRRAWWQQLKEEGTFDSNTYVSVFCTGTIYCSCLSLPTNICRVTLVSVLVVIFLLLCLRFIDYFSHRCTKCSCLWCGICNFFILMFSLHWPTWTIGEQSKVNRDDGGLVNLHISKDFIPILVCSWLVFKSFVRPDGVLAYPLNTKCNVLSCPLPFFDRLSHLNVEVTVSYNHV